MTSPRPGSWRSTHRAWSLHPADQRRTDSPKIGGSVAAKISTWVAAAILAGAGIWGGVTWAIILSGTKWQGIAVAIAVEAVIVAGAIAIPRLRPKMLLVAGVAVFMTAIAVAFLLPRTWCFGYNFSGGPPYDCHDFPLWGRILVAGVGLVVGLILASFARGKPDRAARRSFNA